MRPPRRTEVLHAEGYDIRILGAPRAGIRDLYHWLLEVPWWAALGVIVLAFLVLNALFALVYLAVGGVANAAPGSFLDAFFFSVETMGTIGYGSMYPATRAANWVMVAESVVGLLITALATGLVFARFSQTRARVVFSSRLAIGPMEGVPTLMIRVGNERHGRIVDAFFRLTLQRATRTAEGVAIYRTTDLTLVRERAAALARSWMILHRLAEGSPLAGESPESLRAADAEITLAVIGTDETSLQPVHAQHTWTDGAIVWGARLADVMTETPDGKLLIIDLAHFHEVAPTEPTPAFPYRAGERVDAR